MSAILGFLIRRSTAREAPGGLHESLGKKSLIDYFLGAGSGILAGGAVPAGGGMVPWIMPGVLPQQPQLLTATLAQQAE
jgi:hypothetical protein